MGELHLEILVNRLRREFLVETNQGKPQVVYRETVSQAAEHEEIFQRELAGQQHYAGVRLQVAPGGRGGGNRFVDHCETQDLSEEILPAVRQGVREAEEGGVLMGYPITDIQTTLLEVRLKEAAPDLLALKVAAGMAFKGAVRAAQPVLLEPIMKTEVLAPEEFTGEVISDLNARQGRIEAIVKQGPLQVITASVPLSKMFGYSTALRSASQGRGTFSMQFSRYDRV